jgi:hypothetical protein
MAVWADFVSELATNQWHGGAATLSYLHLLVALVTIPACNFLGIVVVICEVAHWNSLTSRTGRIDDIIQSRRLLSKNWHIGHANYIVTMPRKPTKPDDPAQYKRFLEAAREAQAEDSEEAADHAFKRIVEAKAKSKKPRN